MINIIPKAKTKVISSLVENILRFRTFPQQKRFQTEYVLRYIRAIDLSYSKILWYNDKKLPALEMKFTEVDQNTVLNFVKT